MHWSTADFILAGSLVVILAFAIWTVKRKVPQRFRIVVITLTVLLFMLVWAELAVGVFGTPLSGS